MTSFSDAYLRHCRLLALAFVGAFATTGLIGCSDTPHDRVDAPAPAKMTTLPTPGKTASQTATPKPAAATVPVPSEADLGIPIYPGAKTYVDAGGIAVKPQIEASMGTAILETPDALDKAVDFYKARIKEMDARGNAVPATPSEETADGKRKVVLTGNDTQGNMQMVQLREETGKTVIELMRANAKTVPSSVSGGK